MGINKRGELMNIIYNFLINRADFLTDHTELINALIVAVILFVAAIAFFVCGLFVYKKLFFTLSLISIAGYFYVNLNYLDIEFLWLIVTMMGVVMFILEALVPGIQFFALVGILFLAIGISNSIGSIGVSIIVIALALLISMILIYVFTRKGYRIKAFDKFVLHESIDSVPVENKKSLVGKEAITTSALKPTGKGVIEGVTYDLYSESGYIPENTSVIVIKEEGIKIIVRRSE